MDTFRKNTICRSAFSISIPHIIKLYWICFVFYILFGKLDYSRWILFCYDECFNCWFWRYYLKFKIFFKYFLDLMPSNNNFLIITLILILLGLIITTTCIDIVGAYYIDQLHFFGRRLDIEVNFKILTIKIFLMFSYHHIYVCWNLMYLGVNLSTHPASNISN